MYAPKILSSEFVCVMKRSYQQLATRIHGFVGLHYLIDHSHEKFTTHFQTVWVSLIPGGALTHSVQYPLPLPLIHMSGIWPSWSGAFEKTSMTFMWFLICRTHKAIRQSDHKGTCIFVWVDECASWDVLAAKPDSYACGLVLIRFEAIYALR